MANYSWQRVPGMLKTTAGRKRLWNSILYRLGPVIIPSARFYRRTLIRRVKIIAVIGSFGKTTTTRAVAAAIDCSPEKYQGFNNNVLLAVGILSIPPWANYWVLEVGISKKGQMANNTSLLRPGFT